MIVWADDWTRYYGAIEAKGGAASGNGGLVEVSGKNLLAFDGRADVTAPNGRAGTILLDPRDIIIQHSTPAAQDAQVNADSTVLFADGVPPTDFIISDEALEGLSGSIVLQAQRDIKIQTGLSGGLSLVNQGPTERVALQAGRDIEIKSHLTTYGANIIPEADSPHSPSGGSDGVGPVKIDAAVSTLGGGATTGSITLIGGGNSAPGGGYSIAALCT